MEELQSVFLAVYVSSENEDEVGAARGIHRREPGVQARQERQRSVSSVQAFFTISQLERKFPAEAAGEA